MRLLIATDAFPPNCGGSGWSTFYLARAMQARGHQVQIVQPKRGAPGVRTREYAQLAVTEWAYAASNVPGLRAWQRTSVLDKNFAAFLAERARAADVIHAQHLLTIPAAVASGRLAKVPVVSTVRDYWPVCLYGTLWRSDGICPGCRGDELTHCLAQKYGVLASFGYPFAPFVQRELARRQRALRDSNAVIAVSQYVAETLRGIVQPDTLHVIPNLIDIEETRRLASNYPIRTTQYLLFIGKLNPLKGADLLPEILRRARVNLKLIVVGDGALRSALAREPNVEVRGWLPNQEALALLARARALLFPSRWADPLARVLLEAQALCTPTVALDTGGTHDIIQHESNGLLARDVNEFAAQLARLINDDALCERLRHGARQIAEARFSDKVVAQQMEEVYQKAIGRKQRSALDPQHSALSTEL
jgi:glycogen synthase